MARKRCIFIVDDDPTFAKQLAEGLPPDFTVERRHSAEEALQFIRENPRRIALGIVDVRLAKDDPKDQRGLEAMHLLSSYRIPTIAVSAYAYTPEAHTVRDALVVGGATNFHFKTEGVLALLDAIKQVLEESQTKPAVEADIWPKLAGFTSVVLLVLGAVLLVWQIIKVESAFTLVISAVIVLVSIVLLFVTLRGGLRAKDFRELFTALLGRWFGGGD